MSFKLNLRKFLVLCAALAFATACAGPDSQPEQPAVAQQLPPMDTLVTTEWLSEHLDDPDLVVLDCTVRIEQNEDGGMQSVSGRADYEDGHIPSAGFADLMGDLRDSDSPNSTSPCRLRSGSAESWARWVSATTPGSCCTTASNSAWAARVWWMLRWVGFDRAALLDGGLGPGPPRSGRCRPSRPADRANTSPPALRPELIADRDEVLAAITDDSVPLIDAMPEPHFRGEMAMYDRPGHIPGAVNIPIVGSWTSQATTGRRRSWPRCAGDRGRPGHHLLRWRHRRVRQRVRHDPARLHRRRRLHRLAPGMGRRPRITDGG